MNIWIFLFYFIMNSCKNILFEGYIFLLGECGIIFTLEKGIGESIFALLTNSWTF